VRAKSFSSSPVRPLGTEPHLAGLALGGQTLATLADVRAALDFGPSPA